MRRVDAKHTRRLSACQIPFRTPDAEVESFVTFRDFWNSHSAETIIDFQCDCQITRYAASGDDAYDGLWGYLGLACLPRLVVRRLTLPKLWPM